MNDDALWQTKLHARLHDPAEKALILMRTAHGHEAGTSRALQSELFPQGIPDAVKQVVKRADHWASAADRAAFPKHEDDARYPRWQQVEFHKNPVIIHPLTGGQIDLKKLTSIEPAQAEALSLDHFRQLVHGNDLRKTALAFWRFGPEIDAPEIEGLWGLLPADTRVPDHSIWDHLDLTAAFAGAFALDQDGGPALLAVSLGPVQDFIAASRTTSDLWAGSHLLSRIAWEAMKVVCEELGPEAILFPRLRRVPQVDVWLREDCGIRPDLFSQCDWAKGGTTDTNPLFAAALPNRFTALVPANRAQALGERITTRVRAWVLQQGEQAFRLLLKEADIADDSSLPGYAQLGEQLAGFPEVHWAAVPWSLVPLKDGRVVANTEALAQAMQPFFIQQPPGYLGTDAWKLLAQDIQLEDGWFWQPNPGALYPALHELLERLLTAAKSVRPFAQIEQTGWRCSLTGETEWLTTDRAQLAVSPRTQDNTLWARVAAKRPAWARKGEHLGALATLKRLWPNLFVNEIKSVLDRGVQRFVVSTHTMALATSLAQWIESGARMPGRLAEALDRSDAERVALPRRLALALHRHPDGERLARLPGWLEAARESEDEGLSAKADQLLKQMLGKKPETYYALVLMDGDRMGAWLSAVREHTLPHASSFHPQIAAGLQRFSGDPKFKAYADSLRAANPARHMAISDALNNFALTLAPAVVEGQHHGRILYAGGDDLMAMLPVSDLLPAMAALRAAYSGIDPKTVGALDDDLDFARQANGFVVHRRRLLRLMGEKATASIGAVIAHHQAPLGAVRRELVAAEKRAKNEGGRDAFSITVVKRSGGALFLTCKWTRAGGDSPMTCLRELSTALRDNDASRRAAFHVQAWSTDLPEPQQLGEQGWRQMLTQLMRYQFNRQGLADPDTHAQRLADMAPIESREKAMTFINNFLSVAEFLARETRSAAKTGDRA